MNYLRKIFLSTQKIFNFILLQPEQIYFYYIAASGLSIIASCFLLKNFSTHLGIYSAIFIAGIFFFVFNITEYLKQSFIIKDQFIKTQQIAKIGNWLFSLKDQKLTWSSQHYKIFEIDEPQSQENLYRLYRSKIHPKNILELDNLIKNAIRFGQSYTCQQQLVLKNGRTKYVEAIGNITQNSSGKIIYLHGTCQDITDRIRKFQLNRLIQLIDQALSIENDFDKLIDKLIAASIQSELWCYAAYWIVDPKDESLKLLNVNTSTPNDRFSDFVNATKKSVFKEGKGLPGRVFQNKTPCWIPDVSLDENFPRRSYARDCSIYGALAFPILSQGQVIGVFELFSEYALESIESLNIEFISIGMRIGQGIEKLLTEQQVKIEQEKYQIKAAELEIANKKILTNEKKLKAVLDVAIDAVIQINNKGIVTDWNKQAEVIFGWTSSESIGRPLDELIIPLRYKNLHRNGLEHFLATGNGPVLNQRIEIFSLRKTGEEFPIELAITPFKLEDQFYFSAFVRDITERIEKDKTIDQQRIKLSMTSRLASLGELSAGVAHEINNPLTIISATTISLSRFKDDPEKFKNKIDVINKACERINKIVKSLKRFTHSAESGVYKNHSLAKIAKESIELTEIKSRQHHVSVICDIQSESEIFCDDVEISQVIINLINNAIDAVKDLDDKWVNIKITENNEIIFLKVVDSGPGIPDEIRTKIFNPFFTTKSVGEGTGLGLSITKGILDEHKAVITVITDAPNTSFEVFFKKAV